tara:strand:+ start:21397 stop:22347 length:951 start_codon:yes stop_codon:yes gene_type:complete
MKWMLLVLFLISTTTYATKQFTEAECILLKHQITDYKRRLGVNSSLYQETNTSVKRHCKSPVTLVKKSNHVLTTSVINTSTPVTANKTVLLKPDTKKPRSVIGFNPLDIIIKALSFSWPLWIVVLLLGILRLPSVKGKLGERYVSKGLRNKLPSDQYHLINDVTLPLDDGGTTQIDHVVVSTFGVFVIETKNMKGWIFGSEKQAKWTQTIYRTKYSFQNPLRQNYKHTQTLAQLLNLSADVFHSVIIFTPNAELKTNMPSNVGHLKEMIPFIKSFKTNLIEHKEQLEIKESISNISLNRGYKTNKDHVSYLKSKHG